MAGKNAKGAFNEAEANAFRQRVDHANDKLIDEISELISLHVPQGLVSAEGYSCRKVLRVTATEDTQDLRDKLSAVFPEVELDVKLTHFEQDSWELAKAFNKNSGGFFHIQGINGMGIRKDDEGPYLHLNTVNDDEGVRDEAREYVKEAYPAGTRVKFEAIGTISFL